MKKFLIKHRGELTLFSTGSETWEDEVGEFLCNLFSCSLEELPCFIGGVKLSLYNIQGTLLIKVQTMVFRNSVGMRIEELPEAFQKEDEDLLVHTITRLLK